MVPHKILFWGLAALLFSMLAWGTPSFAVEEETSWAVPLRSPYADFKASVEKPLTLETEKIKKLKRRLHTLEATQKTLSTELGVYKIELSSHGNLLSLSSPQIENLEKAWASQQSALKRIAAHTERFTQQLEPLESLIKKAGEQSALNQKELATLQGDRSTEPEKLELAKAVEELNKTLRTKEETLKKIQAIYQNQLKQVKQVQTALTGLSGEFEQQINAKKTEALFKRNTPPVTMLHWNQIVKDIKRFGRSLRFSEEAGLEAVKRLKSGSFHLIALAMWLFLVFFLTQHLRRFCIKVEASRFCSELPWRSFSLELFQRSLPILGAALFVQIYIQAQRLDATVPFTRTLIHLMWIILFIRWSLDFFRLLRWEKKIRIPKPLLRRFHLFLFLILVFSVSYLLTSWLLKGQGPLLFLERLLFEMLLLMGVIDSWRIVKKEFGPMPDKAPWGPGILRQKGMWLSYIIAAGGLILEFSSYGTLALHWYVSWGLTWIAFMWSGLLFLTLREWERKNRRIRKIKPDETEKPSYPIQWFTIRLLMVSLFFLFLIVMAMAWGAKQTVFVSAMGVLSHSVQLGGISLSLAGGGYAVLILFLTHAVVRLWRYLFRKKILADSGLALGLQESLTTITSYLLWIIGILAALSAFGLSTTSLAVAFGALGVGLGFGLQNIFNNFVSGIILLFERPIQVGDAVEINDTWGIVQKINVRSTVVQTYDNASLIIPNSDFVSNQVTNWSFKDPKVRRQVRVGVAYGSDIERVRKLLLEIAQTTQRIYKYPEPDVLFEDFGDSALIFNLRFWVYIDYMLPVETTVRFKIDKRFRENGIEIAFPQRDLHIRTTPNQDLPVKENNKPEEKA